MKAIIFYISFFSAIALIIYLIKKYMIDKIPLITQKFKATSTLAFLNGLHPEARNIFSKFISEIESPANGNLRVLITSGTRSFDKQTAMVKGEGNTPTSVSLHNFGFAIDMNITGTDKKGTPINLKMSSPTKDWQPYVDIGKKYGLTWGGDFKNTATPDRVHFSYGGESKAKTYLTLLQKNKVDNNGFVIV